VTAPIARALAGLLAGALVLAGCGGARPDAIVVAAASDLRPVLPDLVEEWSQATGVEVSISFGSSGQVAQQLIEGAPMDLYLSADGVYVDRVLDAGVGDADSRAVYAFGRLVLWSRADAWQDWKGLADLDGATTIAIANPEHAPYGRAARQALEAAGVWEQVAGQVVLGENVADAHRLAATGNVDVAVVAASLAGMVGSEGSDGAVGSDGAEGRWVPIDEALHEPLRQELLVVASDPARAAHAAELAAWLLGEAGREALEAYGFGLP
jgi:molybdate transport system substrate-binding protein